MTIRITKSEAVALTLCEVEVYSARRGMVSSRVSPTGTRLTFAILNSARMAL